MEYEINTETKALDWNARGVDRILQNVLNLISTWRYEVAYDRTKGIDTALIDKPISEAVQLYQAEVYRVVETHEPRAKVKKVEPFYTESGEVDFKVVIEVVTD